MTNIIIFLGITSIVLFIFIALAIKDLAKKEEEVKELRAKVDFLKEINKKFEQVENETKKTKEHISSGSVTDNVNASADVLRDIKKRRRASNN